MLRYGTSPLAQHLLSTNGLGCLIDIGKTPVQDFAQKKGSHRCEPFLLFLEQLRTCREA